MASEGITRAWKEAKRLRRRWQTGNRPAPVLFDLAGRKGILVFRLRLDSHLSGAFLRSRKHNKAIIIVNTAGKTACHQRFTLAHELGHLHLHEDQDAFVAELGRI